MRIVFDKNVPIGVRGILTKHEVFTFSRMPWHPQLEDEELLYEAEAAGFDVLITSDQNLSYQQNLKGRKLALVVLGSNIWPIVRGHAVSIVASADAATPGSFDFIEMHPPPKRRMR